jgi:hypothetical protein
MRGTVAENDAWSRLSRDDVQGLITVMFSLIELKIQDILTLKRTVVQFSECPFGEILDVSQVFKSKSGWLSEIGNG